MSQRTKRKPLELTTQEIVRLQYLRNSRNEPYEVVRRAEILLGYWEGKSIIGIAREVGVVRDTVEKCIDKALAGGVEIGLRDFPRSGRPPVITLEAKMWVVDLACTKPTEYGYAAEMWTLSQLASHVQQNAEVQGHLCLRNAQKGQIHAILNEGDIQPHRVQYYLQRRDPQFQEKMAAVLTVYKEVELINTQAAKQLDDVQRKSTTISFDEKPGIQAIANTSPDLPPVPGEHPTWSRDHEYKRLGTISLLAGIDLHDGHVIGIARDQHRSEEFTEYLGKLHAYYQADWKIRIILDNHSVHISKKTVAWLQAYPGRFEFVFTPKHGSWLNIVESFFSKMTRSVLRHMRVSSKEELLRRLEQYLDELNTNPIVFKWQYKMDTISL